MSSASSILDYWPIQSPPRENQRKALLWLEANSDKKYKILEAPVGSGKSLIGITYARWKSGGDPKRSDHKAYILTPQKILQKQYMSDFATNELVEAAQLFGKSNYECTKGPVSCAVGESVLKCNCTCYKAARSTLAQKPTAIMNYASAFSFFTYTQFLSTRKTMVIDECHNLESVLVNFDTLSLTKSRCDKLQVEFPGESIMADEAKAFEWINTELLSALQDRIVFLKEELEELEDDPSMAGLAGELQKCLGLAGTITNLPTGIDEFKRSYIVYATSDTEWTVKPIYAKNGFERIQRYADNFVLMSGTIPNMQQYCDNLGIRSEDTAFLSLDSDFPKENRPVVFLPVMKMNYKWREDEEGLQQMEKMIRTILQMHSGQNGVIHTTSFSVAKWVTDQIKRMDLHDVYDHNPIDGETVSREKQIEQFSNSTKPSVLVSPSVTEGLDLKNDMGRFNIVVKLPYPYLGDKWIKKRMELSSEWYIQQTLIDLMQASGRTTRSKDDSSSFYILDSSWYHLMNSSRKYIPDWWLENYQIVS